MSAKKGWRSRAGFTFECDKQEAAASGGMISANHPMASLAGAEMLARGGNAVDAAVATAFALTVVEPMMVGIFGAGFFVYYDAASGEVVTIDNYAVSPLAATPDMYQPDDASGPMETMGQANMIGHLSVGVPGALKAWCHVLERFGRMDPETVMGPAIRYAEGGFPASPYLVSHIQGDQENLARYPASAAVFLPQGRQTEQGDLITNPDYANTLRLIAAQGSDVLYHGSLGEAVAADMAANGGLITMQDLTQYQIRPRQPLRSAYRGCDIASVGPTSSGGIQVIQALNLLEEFELSKMGYGSPRYFHLLLEVLRVCWADRFAYLGDPETVDIPVDQLTSKVYADHRRPELDLERTRSYGAGKPAMATGESGNTTHLTVADSEGNIVTATQTINQRFGSRVMPPGTGMLLNDCMALFDPHPGRPNSVGPGKRMVSSMSPTIVFRDDAPWFALGTPGGSRISAAVLQAILNVIDHGMSLQEAVEAPRVWTQGEEVEVEQGVPEEVRQALESKGHRVKVVTNVAGGMNGVLYDRKKNRAHGAACWRSDGVPVGISGGPASMARLAGPQG
jgi:gamma-glutamyltranspeptidase/glutathione hydrolase